MTGNWRGQTNPQPGDISMNDIPSDSGVGTYSICGRQVTGLGVPDDDGRVHAVIIVDSRLIIEARTSSQACHNIVPGGATVSSVITYDTPPNGRRTLYHRGLYPNRVAWPGLMYSPSKLKQQCPYAATGNASVLLLWDGYIPTARTEYSLLPSIFTSVDTMSDSGGWISGTPNPGVRVEVIPPLPNCSTQLNGATNTGTTQVQLTSVQPDASCGTARGCAKKNYSSLGSTTFQVTCSLAAGTMKPDQQATVTPRLTFQGARSTETGAYLLQSSQSGVFVWGATTGNNGCGNWGTTSGAGYGAIPFDGVTRWVPAGFSWGSTASGWAGSAWRNASATVNWGVCVDTSGGGRAVHAGPFTATATWTLHLD